MEHQKDDAYFMGLALELARRAAEKDKEAAYEAQ